MASLDKPPVVTTTVKWRFPAVHPEGRKYIVASAAISLILLFFVWDELGFLFVGVTLWVASFFRDPVRAVPSGDDLIVSPADGLVTLIQEVAPPREMAGDRGLGDQPMIRVSIFMSVFDVHINRAPIGGRVLDVVYISGKFLNADLDKASDENERQHILMEREDGTRIGFTQIAGLVARRIVPFVKPGDIVAHGQRIGLIRFGSRVDVYLPAGTAPRVALGQRAIAGETILGVIGRSDAATAVPQ
ncbi:phosphatidylserine decarboxylase [Sphingomonas jejuensis]|jgi:phosphatidylserine decarboxylase|uniref:Phosphatidylserine decarboxylase proenzyme n=1 Tax=Sphingomonas jejuensis TaxID=904715 RepID=A0ABX0XJV6_9SPHN|nr:phosphatidylserine decarboxylase [Sphingomonas jejuensis]NJC33520.1 phosphatidylserine decarboxylase [Sphingomonas jejuensis]